MSHPTTSLSFSEPTNTSSLLSSGDEDQGAEDEAEDTVGDVLPDGQAASELPSLEVGIVYPNLEDVKLAVKAHAISEGWTSGVHKRDKTRELFSDRRAQRTYSPPHC